MDGVTTDVLTSPAVNVLLDLERDGFMVTLADDGALNIRPRSRLTPDRMETIAAYRDVLRWLVRICDADVQKRRAVFDVLIAATPTSIVLPALLYRPAVPYISGICFSCGEPLQAPVFGRCWRCALAMRLAMRVPISPESFSAHVTSRLSA